jgi:hypothetical protein
MNASRRNPLVLVAAVLACAFLGYLVHASRQRGASIREALAARPPVPPTAPTSTIEASAAPAEHDPDTTTVEHRELAERTALLEDARRVPELARREAALRVIQRIRADHEATPPAPRPVPPPVPRDAPYFSELLDDPEYLQLVARSWRSTTGAYYEEKLSRFDVPEELRRKVVELEFDSQTAGLDAQRYLRRDPAERTAAAAASKMLRDENNAAIRQILGEDAYATYRNPVAGRTVQELIPSSVFEPLATRLSYTGSPLDPATRQRLTEMLQSMSSPAPGVRTMTFAADFIERARSILQPGQVAALDELRTEYEAARARSRLPKTSELPRTTRRQRLDATAEPSRRDW